MKSTFIFIGQLMPKERCENLNTWPTLKLTNGMECIVLKDGLAVEFVDDPANFDKLFQQVKELLNRMLDAHSLFADSYLDVNWKNWIENKAVESKNNTVGWVDPFLTIKPNIQNHHDNVPFFKAASIL